MNGARGPPTGVSHSRACRNCAPGVVLVEARPRDAAQLLEPGVAHARVHRRERAQLVPDVLGARVVPVVPEPLGEAADDLDVVAGVPGRVERLAHALHPPLAVRDGALGLAPARGRRQDDVGHLGGAGQEDVLDDQVVEALEQLHACAWRRPRTGPGSRRSRTARAARRAPSPSNIWVRCQPYFGGIVDAPGPVEPLARLAVALDVLEAGQLVGDRAHVAAALDVVLAAERVQARAVAADVAGEQGQVDQAEDVVDGVVVLGDAERPADLGPVGARVGEGELADQVGGDAGLALAALERPLLDGGRVLVEAGGGPLDELAVVQALVDDLGARSCWRGRCRCRRRCPASRRPTGPSRCGAGRSRTGGRRCARP